MYVCQESGDFKNDGILLKFCNFTIGPSNHLKVIEVEASVVRTFESFAYYENFYESFQCYVGFVVIERKVVMMACVFPVC